MSFVENDLAHGFNVLEGQGIQKGLQVAGGLEFVQINVHVCGNVHAVIVVAEVDGDAAGDKGVVYFLADVSLGVGVFENEDKGEILDQVHRGFGVEAAVERVADFQLGIDFGGPSRP